MKKKTVSKRSVTGRKRPAWGDRRGQKERENAARIIEEQAERLGILEPTQLEPAVIYSPEEGTN